ERNFLRDGVLEPYLYQAAPAVIFADVIGKYNAQVEPFKQFKVGAVTAEDPNGYLRMESESAEQVSDVIDKLVERVGGYIVFTTDSNGQRVINWYGELTEESDQVIEFGENLLDFSRTGANTEMATRIYPYGAKDEVTGERVTIEAVTGGKKYVQDDDAVARYGTIAKAVYYDDVTLAMNLKTKAEKDLAVSKLIVTTLELSVTDLADAGYTVGRLNVGLNVPVRCEPYGIDDKFLLRERTYDLLAQEVGEVVLGKERTTMTRADVAGDRRALNQIQRTVQDIKTSTKDRIVYATAGTDGGYDAPEGSGVAEVVVLQAVIPTAGWEMQPTPDGGFRYGVYIAVPGIRASDNPVIDIYPEDLAELTGSTLDAVLADWAKIAYVVTSDGGIAVWGHKSVSVEIPIKIMCVR
ncbi:MAG: phage tail protein, partial [Akkermansia sp.]|nr:phage tail protein [Akkermansia sp.]